MTSTEVIIFGLIFLSIMIYTNKKTEYIVDTEIQYIIDVVPMGPIIEVEEGS